MSPLRRQSTIFLQSKFTKDLNPEPFWTDGTISSPFHEETPRLFEGATMPLEGSPVLPTKHLLPPSADDHFGPPSAAAGDVERVSFADFTLDTCVIPFGNQPVDLFDHIYQPTYTGLFQNNYETCDPAQTMTIYEVLQPAPTLSDDSIDSITQTLSVTHFPPEPVGPSTMTAYAPYFDHGCGSQALSTPGNGSIASLPPTSSPPSSFRCDSSESNGEGDTDYFPPSDDDEEEYRPTRATSSKKQKKRKAASKDKPSRHATFSPAHSTSKSEKSVTSSRAHRRSHPYKRPISSRNFQRENGSKLINKESDFQCPVVGCDYVQENRRIPDLKRHVVTHDRWMEPEKWTCCGVGMERAYLYGKGIEKGMTEEEQIKAGACIFKGQLMIGGCLKTFARRDALKRHVDNSNIPCVGHMDSYFY